VTSARPVVEVAAAWVVFATSHVGLATAPVRDRLVARLGARGFMWCYLVIASVLFSALVAVYASVAGAGPAGLALASTPWARDALIAAIVCGFVLIAGGLAPTGYWASPAMPLAVGARPPYGLERITRHPIFAGVILVLGAHALLAERATGAVFFTGFVVLAIGGTAHQAGKLRRTRGLAYDRYLAATSAIPFVAIARRRQRLIARELPGLALALGVLVAAAVYALHGHLLDGRGAPFSGPIVAGALLVAIVAERRARARACTGSDTPTTASRP
jgi:uncharacterized membrane protein